MPAAPTWVPASPALVEDPESGELNFGDRQTITTIYSGKYDDCVADALPKGTAGSGDLSGYYVSSCRVTRSKGEIGRLITVWEGYSGIIIPGDKFGLRAEDLNPAVEKNAAFNSVTSEELEKIRAAIFTADEVSAAAARAWIGSDGSTAAQDLFGLMKRGVTNFYKPFFTYWWQQHFVSEPSLNTGEEIEAPGGPLSTLISGLGLSCLRKADDLEYNDGGLYVRTRSWLCAKDSYWDSVLYP